jgi:hypothetical protein
MPSGFVTINLPVIPPYTLLVDPNGWTVVVGMREYDDAQYRLVRELDARHQYYSRTDDGD